MTTDRFGHVGIYDEKFRLQRSYDIDIDTDPYADYDVAKSDPGWVTTILKIFGPNCLINNERQK
jgi:hypothetical protein